MQLRLRRFTVILLALTVSLAAPSAQTQAPKVTTPEQFFGHEIGADYVLPNYTKFTEFVKKLDAESDRMIVQSIGKTAEGRDQLMAIITAPENHKNLAKYKDIARRLALAEGLTDDQARALAREGKAVVWIDGGLHATEVLGAQQLTETIYQLVSKNDPETLRFLRDVIILAVARQSRRHGAGLGLVHAPRGSQQARDRRTCRGCTRSTSATTTTATSTCRRRTSRSTSTGSCISEWFPQIIYNHHQTGPDRHDPVRAALPRSGQLRLSPADHHRPRRGRLGDAQPLRRREQARRHDAPRRELLDVVERRPAHRRRTSTT